MYYNNILVQYIIWSWGCIVFLGWCSGFLKRGKSLVLWWNILWARLPLIPRSALSGGQTFNPILGPWRCFWRQFCLLNYAMRLCCKCWPLERLNVKCCSLVFNTVGGNAQKDKFRSLDAQVGRGRKRRSSTPPTRATVLPPLRLYAALSSHRNSICGNH